MNKLENAFYIGIGLALKGKEKIEEFARTIVEDSKMNAEEGKKFVENMVNSAENFTDELNDKIEDAVKRTMAKMGLAPQSEIDELKVKIAKLESKIRKG